MKVTTKLYTLGTYIDVKNYIYRNYANFTVGSELQYKTI